MSLYSKILKVASLACVVGLMATLSGCGTGSKESSAKSGKSADQSAGTNGDASSQSPPQHLGVIGTREASFDGKKVNVELNSVVRKDKLITITYSVVRPDDPSVLDHSDLNLAQQFHRSGGAISDFDGVAVIDGTNQKLYPTARDSQNNCVCSTFKLGVPPTLAIGSRYYFYAVTGAPPQDVKRVDVSIESAGIFNNIDIS